MAVKVNGEEIPESAIKFELNRLVKFYSGFMSQDKIMAEMDVLRKKAVEQAIGAKLLIEEAGRLDIKVPPADVDARLKVIMKQAGGEDKFREILAKQNTSVEMVKQGIESGRRVELLVERITQDVQDPTEEEMKNHFREYSSEYERPEQVNAQHILIQLDADSTDADRKVARSRLNEIRSQIKEGASFKDMAAAYSNCPSGKSGGNLGWFSRGMMIPEFDKAVFSMEVGEMSEVIDTPAGCHLILKTGLKEGGPAEYPEVADRIREFLRHARRGEAITAHVEELKSKAAIEMT